MRLRRGIRVMRTGPDQVQIGIDPRWSVRLHGLSPAQCWAVLHGADRSMRPALPTEVLSDLGRLRLLRPPTLRDGVLPPRLVPDCRGYALVGDGDGRLIRQRRAEAVVSITGLSRTGIQIAVALAGAGVGTLLLDDRRRVTEADTGTGLGVREVGRRRRTAVARLVRELAPGIRIGSPGHWSVPPTLAVTVEPDAVDPERTLRLLSAGVPQLPVVLREADALIGPFAVPGGTSCPRCVELTRADRDPLWPRVLALLCAGDRRSAEPVVLATVAGGLAAADVLTWVDGGQPVTRGRQYEVPLPDLEPRLRGWAAHPECGCAALWSDGVTG